MQKTSIFDLKFGFYIKFHPYSQLFMFQSLQYAHIEVVVTLVAVNFFVFVVIARYPTVRFSRKLVEKLRTGLPDLPKPLRTNILLRKP